MESPAESTVTWVGVTVTAFADSVPDEILETFVTRPGVFFAGVCIQTDDVGVRGVFCVRPGAVLAVSTTSPSCDP